MNITKKQRYAAAICIAALIIIYYGPTVILSVRQFIVNREYSAIRAAHPPANPPMKVEVVVIKPDTPRSDPTTKVEITNPAAPEVDVAPFPLSSLAGFWGGRGTLPGRFCTLHLELRESLEAPGHIMGFPSMVCIPFGTATVKAEAADPTLGSLNPTTAILDGTWDKKTTVIRFLVVKSISSDNCPITGFSVTPIGTAAITAEWKEGECQSGNVVMQRTGR